MILFSYLFYCLFAKAEGACCQYILMEDLVAYSGSAINGIYEKQSDNYNGYVSYKQAL